MALKLQIQASQHELRTAKTITGCVSNQYSLAELERSQVERKPFLE